MDANKLTIELVKGAVDRHRKKKLRSMLQDGVTEDSTEKPLDDEEMRAAMLELGMTDEDDEELGE